MDLNTLLEQERKTRLANDVESHYQVLHNIFANSPRDQAMSLLKLLINRKSQVTSNIKCIMREIGDDNILELLALLDGKILYEEERVFFSDKLREICEARGDKVGALDAINIPVETFCSITKEAIYEYQLNQLRLAIETGNFDLGLVLSRRFQIQEIEYQVYMVELNKELKQFYKCAEYCEQVIEFYKKAEKTSTDLTDSQSKLLKRITRMFVCDNLETIQKLTIIGTLFSILGSYPEDFASSKHNINEIRKLAVQFKTPKLIKKLPECMRAFELRDEFVEHIKKHNVNVVRQFYKKIKFEDFEMLLGIPIDQIFDIVEECRIDVENKVCIFKQNPLSWQEVVQRITNALTTSEV